MALLHYLAVGNMAKKYELPLLPYNYNALEPIIIEKDNASAPLETLSSTC